MDMNGLSPMIDITEYCLPLDLYEVFGNRAQTALEIGFGDGGFLAYEAKRMGHWNFVGIEIKKKRFEKALKRLERENLRNVGLLVLDAKIAIEEVFSPNTFSLVYINFPDPWPKGRHKKHRIINHAFLRNLSDLIEPGGVVEVASDHQEYVCHILDAFEETGLFRNEFRTARYPDAMTNRPATRYEMEFRQKGREIYYLRLRKIEKHSFRRI